MRSCDCGVQLQKPCNSYGALRLSRTRGVKRDLHQAYRSMGVRNGDGVQVSVAGVEHSRLYHRLLERRIPPQTADFKLTLQHYASKDGKAAKVESGVNP